LQSLRNLLSLCVRKLDAEIAERSTRDNRCYRIPKVAIYAYLTAVHGPVAVWAAEGREIDRARRALRLRR
jgi:hypothetical protein